MPATIEAEIHRHAQRVNAVLESLVPPGRKDFLSEPCWYHLSTGGKRIRPALCLMVCEAFGGDSDRALPFAAAVELLHNMLLVHDDIADGDTVRRNKPAVWVKYGLGNGVNVGDYLLARGLHAVMMSPVEAATRMKLLEVYLETFERTVEGQALDINFRCNERFTVEEYLRMAVLKTGHYLVVGMLGGALVAGASEAALHCLRKLGGNLGPAFQIRDDLIDLTAGKGRGGVKGSDVREGKPSILYAHALSHSSPAECERLLEILRKPREQTSEQDVAWVIGLYERCGSLQFAQQTADGLIAEALAMLDTLPVEQQPGLRRIIVYIAERTT